MSGGDSLRGFGRVPRWWLALLPTLTGAERGVALALAAYADAAWKSRPGNKLIAERTGHTERTVQHALKRMRVLRMIELSEPAKGRGRAAVYLLIEKGGEGVTVSDTERVTPSDRKGRPVATQKGGGGVGPTERTEIQQQGGAAAGVVRDEQGKAAPAVEHPKVTAVLDRVGLDDPAACAEVAGVDGIELVIEELGKRAAKGDNPAGLLRVLVRDEAPALIAKARAAEAVKAKRKAAVVAEHERRDGEAERRRQAEQRLDAMSKAEREALRAEVLACFDEPSGKVHAKPSDALVRRWMVDELVERRGVADKTSTRG